MFRKAKQSYYLAFPSGEGGPRQWWMRRSKSVPHERQAYKNIKYIIENFRPVGRKFTFNY